MDILDAAQGTRGYSATPLERGVITVYKRAADRQPDPIPVLAVGFAFLRGLCLLFRFLLRWGGGFVGAQTEAGTTDQRKQSAETSVVVEASTEGRDRFHGR
jgi:hypothetical protein